MFENLSNAPRQSIGGTAPRANLSILTSAASTEGPSVAMAGSTGQGHEWAASDVVRRVLATRHQATLAELADLRAAAHGKSVNLARDRPDELPLAGYLLACSTIGETVDAEVALALQAGQQSLADTHRALPLGQSNLVPNNMARDFEPAARNAASTDLRDKFLPVLLDPDTRDHGLRQALLVEPLVRLAKDNAARFEQLSFSMLTAVMALLAGSGRCDEHAWIAAVSHARRLQDGQSISVVGGPHPFKHRWTEVHDDKGWGMALDNWAKGPVVLTQHARRSSLEEGSRDTLVLTPAEAVPQDFHAAINWGDNSKPDPDMSELRGAFFEPMPVVSDSFIADVDSALLRHAASTSPLPPQLMSDVRAAGSGTRLGLDVKSATVQSNTTAIDDAMRGLSAGT